MLNKVMEEEPEQAASWERCILNNLREFQERQGGNLPSLNNDTKNET
jgi:hypothetical protein